MTPRLAHIMGRFLGRSETFVYDMLTRVPGFEHHVLTTRTENLELFPFERLIVTRSEEEYAGHVGRLRASAVVCHFGPAGIAGIVPGLVTGVPVVTIFHGYDASMLLRDRAWVERYQALFRFGAHAICVSEVIRQRLVRIGCPPDRASMIHLGVDLTRFPFEERRRRRPGDPLRLLVVARLTEKKGIPVALRAMRRLLEGGIDVSLRIVGEGEQRTVLLELRRTLGLERHVTFVGPLDRPEVRRELAGTDLFLQTSIVAANGDEEGIPIALVEAMASGVPVIASRHAGIPELVDHNRTGVLVPEGDDVATADAVTRLGADGALARQLAASARAYIEAEFQLERQMARYGALLQCVIAGHHPAEPNVAAPGASRRMLFIRSVPTPMALSKLVVLRHRYPDVEFWVLTRDDSRQVFEACPLVSRVLTFPPGRITLATMAAEAMVAIRGAGLERVIVPLDGDSSGYDNVLRVAAACGAERIVMLCPRNDEVAMDGILPEAS